MTDLSSYSKSVFTQLHNPLRNLLWKVDGPLRETHLDVVTLYVNQLYSDVEDLRHVIKKRSENQ